MRKRSSNPTDTAIGADTQSDRQFVTALHRGLEVLRAFRPSDQHGLGNRELAERTNLPNSTISRLTYTLSSLGYLVYDAATGRYRIGVPVLGLGYACLGGMRIRETIQVYMQQLADKCGDGIMIAMGSRDALTMTYIACARAAGVVSLQLNVGSRISLARSAMGRAYLASTTPEERAEIMAQIEEKSDAEHWPILKDGIDSAIQQVNEKGYYINYGEWQQDIRSIAVPYRSPNSHTPLLVFSLGGPNFVLPDDKLEEHFAPMLVELVNMIKQADIGQFAQI